MEVAIAIHLEVRRRLRIVSVLTIRSQTVTGVKCQCTTDASVTRKSHSVILSRDDLDFLAEAVDHRLPIGISSGPTRQSRLLVVNSP